MTFWKAVRNYWYVPLFVVLVVVLSIFFWPRKKSRNPVRTIQKELDAIRAGMEAREWKEKYGVEVARKQVEERFREEKEALTERKRAQAERLKDDPVALSKFLVRAGSDS